MKRKLFPIIYITLILFSCGRDTKKIQNTEQKLFDTVEQDNIYFDYKNTVMNSSFSDTVFIKFSNDTIEDCFTFYMPKGNINKTKSILRISTKDGELIYENVFETSDMVNGYATADIKNDLQMRNYVLEEARNVLSKTSFLYKDDVENDNLIKQTPVEEIQDYDTFLECKNENRALFYTRFHEEIITILGFSRKKKQVVDLFSCC